MEKIASRASCGEIVFATMKERHEAYVRRVAHALAHARGYMSGLDVEDLRQAGLMAIWDVSRRHDHLDEDSDGYYHRAIRYEIKKAITGMLGSDRWRTDMGHTGGHAGPRSQAVRASLQVLSPRQARRRPPAQFLAHARDTRDHPPPLLG